MKSSPGAAEARWTIDTVSSPKFCLFLSIDFAIPVDNFVTKSAEPLKCVVSYALGRLFSFFNLEHRMPLKWISLQLLSL